MEPQEVKEGEVHFETGTSLVLSRFQTRTSPIMLAAARCLLSGVKAQLRTGGKWVNAATSSPVAVSKTFTVGSVASAGSYFQPPGRYWPVTVATREPFGERASCQLQN